jgi:hypothetical protein
MTDLIRNSNFRTGNGDYSHISNLKLDGNSASVNVVNLIHYEGAARAPVEHILIENLNVYDGNSRGIYLKNVDKSNFLNNWIHGNADYGVETDRVDDNNICVDHFWRGNHFFDNGAGFYAHCLYHSMFSMNHFSHNTNEGFIAFDMDKATLGNNGFSENGDDGVCLSGYNSDNIFGDNNIYQNGAYGIDCDGTSGLNTNNRIKENNIKFNAKGSVKDTWGNGNYFHSLEHLGWNEGNGIKNNIHSRYAVISLTDNADKWCYLEFKLPSEFQEIVHAYIIMEADGGGNARLRFKANWAKSTEQYDTHSDTINEYNQNMGDGEFTCIDISDALNAATIEPGDIIGLQIFRDGDDAKDTIDASVHIHGGFIEYI